MVIEDTSTIVALSTPSGYSGIAVVRLSGNRSLSIVNDLFKSKQKIEPRVATFGKLYDQTGYIDTAIVTFYQAPNSYTGEDLVEISLHGNPFLCNLVIGACVTLGARGAEPGEFTRRAFLNGKIDLSQAEGIADIIYSSSRSAQNASAKLLEGQTGGVIAGLKLTLINIITLLELELDFLEEEIGFTPKEKIINQIENLDAEIQCLISSYRFGKMVREGVLCPIIGPPNSGKSSLFNAFLQEERVIVSPTPGTTRDFIEESISVGGYQFRLVDTAGIRDTADAVESIGVAKSQNLLNQGDLVLYILDSSDPLTMVPRPHNKQNKDKTIFILNKSDIADRANLVRLKKQLSGRRYFVSSAKYHVGVHEIAAGMVKYIKTFHKQDEPVFITRLRHNEALKKASSCLKAAIQSIKTGNPSEIIVIDLRDALEQLDMILGKTTNDDILNNIFSNFCVGK